VIEFAKIRTVEGKLKHFPTVEDLNPNTKFIENKFIQKLAENKVFQKRCENLKINWSDEKELIRKIYLHVKESKEYAEYMSSETSSFIEDREFIIQIFKKQISKFDSLKNYYEDLSIYWTDDYHTATSLVIKIMNVFTDDADEYLPLPLIIKTSGDSVDEDRQFTKDLFRKTILKSKEYDQIITDRAVNWEFERIASMDVLILKMALVELFEFSSIPVKVTMNEYIELAKYFSTPKSSTFVNGILDKLITEFTAKDRICKSGRGLM
jgi:N utilization substance protein B